VKNWCFVIIHFINNGYLPRCHYCISSWSIFAHYVMIPYWSLYVLYIRISIRNDSTLTCAKTENSEFRGSSSRADVGRGQKCLLTSHSGGSFNWVCSPTRLICKSILWWASDYSDWSRFSQSYLCLFGYLSCAYNKKGEGLWEHYYSLVLNGAILQKHQLFQIPCKEHVNSHFIQEQQQQQGM